MSRLRLWLQILPHLISVFAYASLCLGQQKLDYLSLAAFALINLSYALGFWLYPKLRSLNFTALYSLVFVLIILGWIELLRLEPLTGLRQTIIITAGVMVLLLTVKLLPGYLILERFSFLWLAIGLVLFILLLVAGQSVNGVRLWLQFKGISFQPFEIAKIAFLIFLTSYLNRFRTFLSLQTLGLRYSLLLTGAGIICLLPFLLLRDLGMSLLLFFTFLTLFYLATGARSWIWGGLACFILALGLSFFFLPYMHGRILAWLNPWQDPYGYGYQTLQGLIALVRGESLGNGIGLGAPFYIPAAATDYIFCALGDELGWLGTAAVILLYLCWIGLSFQLIQKLSDDNLILPATGIVTLFSWQTILLLAGNLRLAPLTGLPLPWVSLGGTAMLANFIMLGLFFKICEQAQEKSLPHSQLTEL